MILVPYCTLNFFRGLTICGGSLPYRGAPALIPHVSLLSTVLGDIGLSDRADEQRDNAESPLADHWTAPEHSSRGQLHASYSTHPSDCRLTIHALHRRFYSPVEASAVCQRAQGSGAVCKFEVSTRQLHTSCSPTPECILEPQTLSGAPAQNPCLPKDPGRSRLRDKTGLPFWLLSKRLVHNDPTTAKRVSEANAILQVNFLPPTTHIL